MFKFVFGKMDTQAATFLNVRVWTFIKSFRHSERSSSASSVDVSLFNVRKVRVNQQNAHVETPSRSLETKSNSFFSASHVKRVSTIVVSKCVSRN